MTCRFPDLSDPRGRACRRPTEIQPRETDTDRPALNWAESSRGVDAALGLASRPRRRARIAARTQRAQVKRLPTTQPKCKAGKGGVLIAALSSFGPGGPAVPTAVLSFFGPGGPPSSSTAAIAGIAPARLAARCAIRFSLRSNLASHAIARAGVVDGRGRLCCIVTHIPALGEVVEQLLCVPRPSRVLGVSRPTGRKRPPAPRRSPRRRRRRRPAGGCSCCPCPLRPRR